jgi:hypothetical protein
MTVPGSIGTSLEQHEEFPVLSDKLHIVPEILGALPKLRGTRVSIWGVVNEVFLFDNT